MFSLDEEEYILIKKYVSKYVSDIVTTQRKFDLKDFALSKAIDEYIKYKNKETYFLDNIKIKTSVIKKICINSINYLLRKGEYKRTIKIDDNDLISSQSDPFDNFINLEIKEKIVSIYKTLSDKEKLIINTLIEEPKMSIKSILEKYDISRYDYKNLLDKFSKVLKIYRY